MRSMSDEGCFAACRRSNGGFTIIELIVVVAIVGILAALAVAVFADYRRRTFNTSALTDLRNCKDSVEAFYVEHGHYPSN